MPRMMKDSGVEWIELIPANWDVFNIRHEFGFGKGLPITKEDLRDSGEPVISYGQIHSKLNNGTTIREDLIRYVDSVFLNTHSDSLVNNGDFIFADTSEDLEGCGNSIYVNSSTPLFAGYHTIILRNKANHDQRYLAYLFQCDAWRSQIRKKVTGVKLFSISQRILRTTTVVVPPFDEQQHIADFLDTECSRVDSVIEQTRASIEEYKKLKQSVITQAVTKGIRPGRRMKDSGVGWLDTIPAEWQMVRGKGLFVEANNRSEDGMEELLTVSQYTGITPRSQKNVNMFEAETLEGYKICEVGDIAANTMWLWAGAIGVSKYRGVISPSYNIYRTIGDVYDDDYLDYLLRAAPLVQHYESLSTGIRASRLRLYPQQFLSIRFPVPPIEEQREIVRYLHYKADAVDELIGKKEQFLTDLESYKKSLIFEYVTGKKAVE